MHNLVRLKYTLVQLQIPLRDLDRARGLLLSGQQLRELGRSGISVDAYRIFRETPTALCLLAAFLWLLFAFSRLWQVQVEGEDLLLNARTRMLLDELGIKPGIPIAQLDTRDLEQQLLTRLPNVRFVEVERVGPRLHVTPIALREDPQEPLAGTSLVSRWDALVEKVTVQSGSARVSPGDRVAAGEVLIEGVTNPTPDLAEPRAVPAQGSVTGRILVQAQAERADVPDHALREICSFYSLRIGEWIFPLHREDPETLLPAGSWECIGPWEVSPVALEKWIRLQKEPRFVEQAAMERLMAMESTRRALTQLPAQAQILAITELTNRDESGLASVQTLIEARVELAVLPG